MRISAIIGHTFGPRPLYISWIFKAIILPRLCYGSIIWANKTSSISKNKLTRVGRLACIVLGRIWPSTPTASIEIIINHMPPTLAILASGFKTWQRLGLGCGRIWDGFGNGIGKRKGQSSTLKTWSNMTSLCEDLPSEDIQLRRSNWIKPHELKIIKNTINIELHLAFS